MAKIRGFKPELWTDDDFVEVSPFARLLWLGMWNFACDNGHLQDKSKQLKGRVLPMDDVNCADLLREIEAQGLIERADGWITIPNLTHHQKPHKRWWVTCEKPGCELPEGASYGYSKPESTVVKPLNNGGATVNNGCSTADGDVEGDGELKVMVSKTPRASHSEPDRFDEFWDAYDKKDGRKPARAKWLLALKKPGVTPDLLILAARSYIEWQKREGKHPQFTKNATTWLNGEHWTDERVTPSRPLGRAAQWLQLAADLGPDQPTNVREIGPSR